VQDTATVRVFHRKTHVDEPADQFPELDIVRIGPTAFRRGSLCPLLVKGVDRLFQAVAPDEPHRVKRAPVLEVAQSVRRHDPRMFQTAGDFRFQQKPLLCVFAGPVLGFDLFERHFPVKFPVHRDGHPAQSAFGVRTQNLETQLRLIGALGLEKSPAFCIKVRSRCRFGQRPGFLVRSAGDMHQTGLHIRVNHRAQIKHSDTDGTESLQALRGIAPVLRDMRIDQWLQQFPL
jgi:hypothetical protein